MTVILVRYAEIALKGTNRHIFERQLRKNIQQALKFPASKVKYHQVQYTIKVSGEEEEAALEKLKKVFGIAWFAPTRKSTSAIEDIVRTSVEVAQEKLFPGKTFAVRAQRSAKTLPYSSVDLERAAGAAIGAATGASVDLENPDVKIFIAASQEGSYVYTEKIRGPGGLPVGTSGKVLALLSGGLDSIAAAYYLAKRGAQVDFLHFHVFPDHQEVIESPVGTIASELSDYTFSKRLFLASYLPFEMRVLALQRPDQKYELVVFRRLMACVAEAIAHQLGYQAILLGDSLGQVASQTIENIVAVDDAVSIPVFRPVIGLDKVEIMKLVRRIGLFEAATSPYKDCCSLISPSPATKAYLPRVYALEKKLDILKIVQEVVDGIEEISISTLKK